MTHDNVKIKFLIEYDKANVTSSYPSLTDYEIATILDKAYLALIARKFTGNNTRRVPFEYDTKAIEDLRPLVVSKYLQYDYKGFSSNEYVYKLEGDHLYYVEGKVVYNDNTEEAELVNHKIAQNFKSSSSNMPWIKNPVVYLEHDDAHLLIDIYKHKERPELIVTYIKEPKKFVGSTWEEDFELSDSMAEELISLAITFALENVESSRLQTKISTLPLEG